MTLEKAIEILTYHNKWRRGDVDDPVYSPKEIGEAIDIIVKFVDSTLYVVNFFK